MGENVRRKEEGGNKMKVRDYLSEASSDTKKYRDILLKAFPTDKLKTKKNIKMFHDINALINIYQKKGKIKVEYRDNAAGNVVPYIGNRAFDAQSIWTAQSIGLEGIFKL